MKWLSVMSMNPIIKVGGSSMYPFSYRNVSRSLSAAGDRVYSHGSIEVFLSKKSIMNSTKYFPGSALSVSGGWISGN